MADNKDKGKKPKTIEQDMDGDLKNVMAGLLPNVTKVAGEAFNPQAAPKPTKGQPIEHEQGGTGQGIKPMFPVVPASRVGEYAIEKQTDEDTFGFEKQKAFDKELNEVALQEVAKERGITVEELLRQRGDRATTVKLNPIDDPKKNVPVPEVATKETVDDEVLALEARLAKLKQEKFNKTVKSSIAPPDAYDVPEEKANAVEEKDIYLQQRLLQQQRDADRKKEEKRLEAEKPGVGKELYDNPIIERLRKKLSLKALDPATVVIEEITFEMLPPPASLNLWILEKLEASRQVSGDGAPFVLALKLATVSAAITTIEGVDIQQLLCPNITDPLEARLYSAQALWEMFLGIPSVQQLFPLHPELAMKLYTAFKDKFSELNLKSSIDKNVHRFVCPMDGCMEMYDMYPPDSGLPAFCKVHGVPMDDKGSVEELRSVPLA
jgi:hypothetical protein